VKDKKIQLVKTSGLIGIVGLAGVTAMMIFWPWGLDTRSLEVEHAKQKAEVIGYQVIQIYKEAKVDSQRTEDVPQVRGLASVSANTVQAGGVLTEFKNQGTMGIDPWGHPYQYRIIASDKGSKLLVWSNGPNGVLDNPSFTNEETKEALNAPTRGDDIKVQLSMDKADSN
jgi:hypothetical protein